MTTLIYAGRPPYRTTAPAAGDDLWLASDELAAATGWKLEPQGLCRGDACVPMPPDRKRDWIDEGRGQLDFAAFAKHLGEPALHDSGHGAWSFGPAVSGKEGTGREMGSGPVPAPDFSLPVLQKGMGSLLCYTPAAGRSPGTAQCESILIRSPVL